MADATCVGGALVRAAGLASNRSIKGEKAGVAAMPPHPPQIKEMTDASSKGLINLTFTTATIRDKAQEATFILVGEYLTEA